MHARKSREHRVWSVAAATVALLALVSCLTLWRDVWPPDEPRYIQVAREMTSGGSWLVPHINGHVYQQKPPGFFWLLAACALVFRSWHRLVMILPSVAAAVGCLWITWWFGNLAGCPRTGRLAAWVLAGSLPSLFSAQLVRMDMLLTLCITAALACAFRLCATDSPRQVATAMALYAALGIGTLVKGPVAVGLPALAIGVWVAWSRDWKGLRRLRLGWGLPLYLAIVLAWAVPAAAEAGPGYVWHVLVQQSVGRVTGDLAGSHPAPWHFYLVTFSWMALPWLPFFVASAFARRPDGALPFERRAVSLWWAWWVTTFAFFTLASGKLEIYLLPLVPATALVTGWFWDRVLLEREEAEEFPKEAPAC